MSNQMYPSLGQQQMMVHPVMIHQPLQQGSQQTGLYQPGTIVINNQAPLDSREWSYGICSCFSDMGECCFAFFCPLCYQIKLFGDANETCCSCVFGGLVPLRTKIRTKNQIKGSICNDYCVIYWCTFCALVQMGIEIKNTKTAS